MKSINNIGRALLLSVFLSTIFAACDKEEKDEDNNEITPTPQSIKTGSWSTASGDVGFYISQQSELDTLRIKLSFSGSCSGSIIMTS
jgi:hypothetical protein